jgi:hypothetical protein
MDTVGAIKKCALAFTIIGAYMTQAAKIGEDAP